MAEREFAEDASSQRRIRNGPSGGVSFQQRTSVYSFTGAENEFDMIGNYVYSLL